MMYVDVSGRLQGEKTSPLNTQRDRLSPGRLRDIALNPFADISAVTNQLVHAGTHSEVSTLISQGPYPGLADPRDSKDACGVGFIVDTKGSTSHQIIQSALLMLNKLEHRGACGCDPETSDGAGILTQIPDHLFRSVNLQFELPQSGQYGVGMVFLPRDNSLADQITALHEKIIKEEGLEFLGSREVPTDSSVLGWLAKEQEPRAVQLFIGCPSQVDQATFERKLFICRKQIENGIFALAETEPRLAKATYLSSLSSQSIVYKGLVMPDRLGHYYRDLSDSRYFSQLALVHSRFSTNTFPEWPLAHPYRYIAHNGEINAISGNRNAMLLRQTLSGGGAFGADDWKKVTPLVNRHGSDSATLDQALEVLTLGGIALPHAITMLMPEAWRKNPHMSSDTKEMFRYLHTLMEPWDGPAAVHFTDGKGIGARLDRNGLRPQRYTRTKSGLLVVCSEDGALPIDPADIYERGRIGSGAMIYFDPQKGVRTQHEVYEDMCRTFPFAQANKGWVSLRDLDKPLDSEPSKLPLRARLVAFGWTVEVVENLVIPLAVRAEETLGSMGDDTPLAVLSEQARPLFDYFKQLFAQVTNPPIDPMREKHVMDLHVPLGAKGDFLKFSTTEGKGLILESPILLNGDLRKITELDSPESGLWSCKIDATFPVAEPSGCLELRLAEVCREVEAKVEAGVPIIILSDNGISGTRAPIPSLLFTSAVHNYLVQKGIRGNCSLVIESGEPNEVHHIACLLGFGADAVNPRNIFRTVRTRLEQIDPANPSGPFAMEYDKDPEGCLHHLYHNIQKGLGKGLEKIMAKMGISAVTSYQGAQLFEALGISTEVCKRYFPGVTSRIGGIGLDFIEEQQRYLHAQAQRGEDLGIGGRYMVVLDAERRAERHTITRRTVGLLQAAVGYAEDEGNPQSFEQRAGFYRDFSKVVSGSPRKPFHIRNLLQFSPGTSIPLDQVEPASEIVKRFSTGAMSLGALSSEAHETLARAMNKLGARSNSGEGGEAKDRLQDQLRRSKIKQVASGRFGVDLEYLLSAERIQIKIAQGAKPGEGGQLAGFKVTVEIAKQRNTIPGVTLISPPPHHDIYSIEDLMQLIFDLQNVNPSAEISVKLVAEPGVGTIAAGVVKAGADHVVIAGADGGTGNSPVSSVKHAGIPFEFGLAETQQILVENRLRSIIKLETDGQIATGRDVMVAALLGADEFSMSTWALIAEGCIYLRHCHLDSCTEGVATQRPELKAKFRGKPEHVINYMMYVAEEVREHLAQLGFRTLQEAIGRVDRLQPAETPHPRARLLDLSRILSAQHLQDTHTRDTKNSERRNVSLEGIIDKHIWRDAQLALRRTNHFSTSLEINNSNRTLGAFLSGRIVDEFGFHLADDSVIINAHGVAGQSLGAFLAKGVTLNVEGGANDYVGKGLSGGKITIQSYRNSFTSSIPSLAGNTCLYGATAGSLFIAGSAGERFAVRNSGATTVVEGVGDNACEYMTGGTVVILGPIGKNAFAGMSGGYAYVWDPNNDLHASMNSLAKDNVHVETLNDSDADHIVDLLNAHKNATGSLRAQALLEHFETHRSAFRKITPKEYLQALEKLTK